MEQEYIKDWAQVIMICPCYLNNGEINKPSFEMNQSKKNVQFVCKNSQCQNYFDYDIKVRLVELLNQYYQDNKTLDGFYKYIERKKERIRLRYIQNIETQSKIPFVVIEVCNISRNPHYKLSK